MKGQHKKGISLLIFTKDNPKVIDLIEKIHRYFDETIILDSSSSSFFETLKRRLRFAKIYHLPPVGYPDIYYMIGINLATNCWIFQLDDDDLPSQSLLQDIHRIIEDGDEKNIMAFLVKRINVKSKTESWPVRILRKDAAYPSGTIHWVWDRLKDPITGKIYYSYKEGNPFVMRLKDQYYIIHEEHHAEGSVLKKVQNYAIVESYQYGYKLLRKLSEASEGNSERKIGELLMSDIKLLSATISHIFRRALHQMSRERKSLSRILVAYYYFLVLFYILNGCKNKIKIWRKIWRKGGIIQYLKFYSVKDVPQYLSEDGITNFIYLMNTKISDP